MTTGTILSAPVPFELSRQRILAMSTSRRSHRPSRTQAQAPRRLPMEDRQTARQRKKERFTALFHHISVDLLRKAFFALKQDDAPGTDAKIWQDYAADYGEDLERRAQGLARPGPTGSVPATAVAAGLHTQTGRTATPARGRSRRRC
jgi:hypothetical protein